MKTVKKPSGCGSARHDAQYSVGLSDGKLVIRMKLAAGRCSIGEMRWDEAWDDLLAGKIRNICLCQEVVDDLALKWG
jgi:hypothetical protein